MSLEKYTADDLKKELEKRNYETDKIKSSPKPLDNPDFSKVIEACQEEIDAMTKKDYCGDNDFEHWIYEAAMLAVYGPSVWNWINSTTCD